MQTSLIKQSDPVPLYISIEILARKAYQSMKTNNKSQTIQLSGLSGAGKTEAAKNILKFLCTDSVFEQKLDPSIVLLESFGNAMTGANNNSSRFCKFIEISYSKNGLVCKVNELCSVLSQDSISIHLKSRCFI